MILGVSRTVTLAGARVLVAGLLKTYDGLVGGGHAAIWHGQDGRALRRPGEHSHYGGHWDGRGPAPVPVRVWRMLPQIPARTLVTVLSWRVSDTAGAVLNGDGTCQPVVPVIWVLTDRGQNTHGPQHS